MTRASVAEYATLGKQGRIRAARRATERKVALGTIAGHAAIGGFLAYEGMSGNPRYSTNMRALDGALKRKTAPITFCNNENRVSKATGWNPHKAPRATLDQPSFTYPKHIPGDREFGNCKLPPAWKELYAKLL